MSDPIQTQLNDLTIAVGQMIAGIDDIKKLQSDVVDLLRKHDRTDGRVDQLTALVEKHEIELTAVRTERIRTAARRENMQWWLNNWKNLLVVIATITTASVMLYPQALSVLQKVPVA